MDRGLRRAAGGGTSSWWEAMVLTQPAALCPRVALAALRAPSISQQAARGWRGVGRHGGGREARPGTGLPLQLLPFAVRCCLPSSYQCSSNM